MSITYTYTYAEFKLYLIILENTGWNYWHRTCISRFNFFCTI